MGLDVSKVRADLLQMLMNVYDLAQCVKWIEDGNSD